MNGGLEMDPNPSSFLPLIFVLHNSTNLSSTICFTIVLPYGLVSYHPLLTLAYTKYNTSIIIRYVGWLAKHPCPSSLILIILTSNLVTSVLHLGTV